MKAGLVLLRIWVRYNWTLLFIRINKPAIKVSIVEIADRSLSSLRRDYEFHFQKLLLVIRFDSFEASK